MHEQVGRLSAPKKNKTQPVQFTVTISLRVTKKTRCFLLKETDYQTDHLLMIPWTRTTSLTSRDDVLPGIQIYSSGRFPSNLYLKWILPVKPCAHG